jgi:hypothetical protein
MRRKHFLYAIVFALLPFPFANGAETPLGAGEVKGGAGGLGGESADDPIVQKSTAVPCKDSIRIKGDLRYRNEGIYKEDSKDRNRHRVRARIGISAVIFDGLDGMFRLASGSDDPVSTNQTLGGAFSTMSVGLDLAYLDFHPKNPDGLHVFAGKMKNPFFRLQKTELVWDGDLNPEGAATVFKKKAGKILEFTACLAGFWVEERKKAEDTWLAGAQIGLEFLFAEGKAHAFLGGSFFHYENLKGMAPLVEKDDGFGNSLLSYVDGAGETVHFYAEHYELLELLLEVGAEMGPVGAALFFDFVVNRKADEDNLGWLVGFKIKFPHRVGVHFNYRVIEKDAVVGAFRAARRIGGCRSTFS